MPKEGYSIITIREKTAEKFQRLLQLYNKEARQKGGQELSLVAFFEQLATNLDQLEISKAINEELFTKSYHIALEKLMVFRNHIVEYAEELEEDKKAWNKLVEPYIEGKVVKEETVGSVTLVKEEPVPKPMGEQYILFHKELEAMRDLLISEENLRSILQAPFQRLYPKTFKSVSDQYSKNSTTRTWRKQINKLTEKFKELEVKLPNNGKALQDDANSFLDRFNQMLALFEEDNDIQKIGDVSKPFLGEIQISLEKIVDIEEKMSVLHQAHFKEAFSQLFSRPPTQQEDLKPSPSPS
jgi:hypothetical protein